MAYDRQAVAAAKLDALRDAGYDIPEDARYRYYRDHLPKDLQVLGTQLAAGNLSPRQLAARLAAVRGSTQTGRASRRQITDLPGGRAIQTRRADTIRSQLRAAGTRQVFATVTGLDSSGRLQSVDLWKRGGWNARAVAAAITDLIRSGRAANEVDALRIMAADSAVTGSESADLVSIVDVALTVAR